MFVGVALEGSFDFQQILVLSKSERVLHDKKGKGEMPC